MDLRTRHFQNMVIAALHVLIQFAWFGVKKNAMSFYDANQQIDRLTTSVEQWTELVDTWNELDRRGK